MRHWPKNRLSIEVALVQLCNWVGGRIGDNRTMEKRITRRRGGRVSSQGQVRDRHVLPRLPTKKLQLALQLLT